MSKRAIIIAFALRPPRSAPADVERRLRRIRRFFQAREITKVDAHHLADLATALEDACQVIRRARASGRVGGGE